MAKRLKPTARWNEEWFRELPFKAKTILEFMEDKSATDHNGTGIYVADFGLMEFQMGKGFSISESELMELLGSIVDKIDEKTYFITTYFHDHYGDAKDTYAAKVAAKERLQKRGLMDADGKIIRRSRGSLPPVSPDTQPTVPGDSGESLIILDSIKSIKEGGVGETNPPSDEKSHDTTPAPGSQDPNPPPEKLGPRELAALWNATMANVKSLDGRQMPLVDLADFGPEQAERWRAAKARLAKKPSREYWADVTERMSRSDFCRGKKAQGDWLANFDFLVRPKTAINVMEGQYGCKPKPVAKSAKPVETAPQPATRAHPDVMKVLKYAHTQFLVRTPWEQIRSEIEPQTADAIEAAGGWDRFKQGSPEEIAERLTRLLNQPTAAGNKDHAAQAHAITSGLVQPEARKGIA